MNPPRPITPPSQVALPTRTQLLRATMIALGAAAIIVVTIVMPAEYGMDPTGVGTRLGLRRSAISSTPISAEAAARVTPETAPFKSDQMQVTLEWGEDIEIKATMRRGQSFVFSWESSGGPVNFDMHGEPLNAPTEATSYAKAEEQTAQHGVFHAPFDGKHGWYWENYNEKPVTITLRISGYYATLARQ